MTTPPTNDRAEILDILDTAMSIVNRYECHYTLSEMKRLRPRLEAMLASAEEAEQRGRATHQLLRRWGVIDDPISANETIEALEELLTNERGDIKEAEQRGAAEFYRRVNARAEADMLKGNPITGAHHRALEYEFKALGEPVVKESLTTEPDHIDASTMPTPDAEARAREILSDMNQAWDYYMEKAESPKTATAVGELVRIRDVIYLKHILPLVQECEGLQTERDHLWHTINGLMAEVERLQAERDHLRGALDGIDQHDVTGLCWDAIQQALALNGAEPEKDAS